jgi:hypothetical protein
MVMVVNHDDDGHGNGDGGDAYSSGDDGDGGDGDNCGNDGDHDDYGDDGDGGDHHDDDANPFSIPFCGLFPSIMQQARFPH